MNRQHIPITYLQLLHCLGIVRNETAIVVDVLGGRRDSCLYLDGLSKGGDSHIREDFQRQQTVLVPRLGVEDIQRDAPRSSSQSEAI